MASRSFTLAAAGALRQRAELASPIRARVTSFELAQLRPGLRVGVGEIASSSRSSWIAAGAGGSAAPGRTIAASAPRAATTTRTFIPEVQGSLPARRCCAGRLQSRSQLRGATARACVKGSNAQERDMPAQHEVLYDPTNPYPWYRYMRETNPVHYNEQIKMWYVFRHEDVQRILADVQTFSSVGGAGASYIEASFLHMDPPRHGRYRTLVSQAFTPRSVTVLEPRILTIVNGLLDAVAHTGRMDLITDLAFPLPAMIIMELLGVPAGSREQFRMLSESFIQEIENEPSGVFPSEARLAELLRPFVEARRTQPGDDLISHLLAAEVDGERLDTQDILATCVLMLVAGHETTTRLIGNAMYCFTERPEVMAELREHPALIPGALEEVLRYRPPLCATFRTTTSDVVVGTTPIQAGQAVLVQISSAHHDESAFPDPEVFDIRRRPNRHLGFGQGIHFCLGAPLARLEARIAIQSLLQRFPDLRQAGEEPVRLRVGPAGFFQGTKHFPIAFTAEPR